MSEGLPKFITPDNTASFETLLSDIEQCNEQYKLLENEMVTPISSKEDILKNKEISIKQANLIIQLSKKFAENFPSVTYDETKGISKENVVFSAKTDIAYLAKMAREGLADFESKNYSLTLATLLFQKGSQSGDDNYLEVIHHKLKTVA